MEEGENEVTEEFTRRMDVVEFPPEVRAAAAAFRLGIHTVLDEGGQEPVIDEEEGNRGED
jgi:alpha-D-ribose 1-methylphosphonate 5-triphosphate diphosphatase PhnM